MNISYENVSKIKQPLLTRQVEEFLNSINYNSTIGDKLIVSSDQMEGRALGA